MKIGILTFWWSQDNYGQILQCYALQKYLNDLGHDAYLIRYDFTKEAEDRMSLKKVLKIFNPLLLYKYIKNRISSCIVKQQNNENPRYFNSFKEKYIKWSPLIYNKYDELVASPPDADIYIVGSDQIWNPDGIGGEKHKSFNNILNAYFLNFGTAKRTSYAASWGCTELTDNCINLITPLLKKFQYVSVREKSGIELCKKCGYENAKWVCDPTMLIKPVIYKNIYKSENIRKRSSDFIFLYMLSNKNDFDIESVYKFASDSKLDVIYVSGNNSVNTRECYYASIPEWLYLIDNAKYIITNSYHCGVFSTLFNKQYGIVPLTGKYKGMNSRMDSLFSIFNIESRYIENNDFSILDKKYNKTKIYKTVDELINIVNN